MLTNIKNTECECYFLSFELWKLFCHFGKKWMHHAQFSNFHHFCYSRALKSTFIKKFTSIEEAFGKITFSFGLWRVFKTCWKNIVRRLMEKVFPNKTNWSISLYTTTMWKYFAEELQAVSMETNRWLFV